jgi:superfamily II DNA or RNA helicase
VQHPLPAPGSLVIIRQRRWQVLKAHRDRQYVWLDVHDRHVHATRTFVAPFDRPRGAAPTARWRRARAQHAAARFAGLIARTPGWREPAAAIDAGVTIVGYQLEPALAVLAGDRRVLIADEVGLGKTIQAGLIVAELARRLGSLRALIVVPASLVVQWGDELRTKFGLECAPIDRHALEHQAREDIFGDSPWRRPGIRLVSADFLKQPQVIDSLPAAPWDLVIIDEAHDASGPSDRHAACGELARRARRLVLLTATPHSGESERFERLLALGALPDLAEPMTVFRRTRAEVGFCQTRRVRWTRVRPSDAERAVLDALREYTRAALDAAMNQPHAHRRDAARLLMTVLRKRALSTSFALARSLQRRLQWLEASDQAPRIDWVQRPLRFDDDPSDDAEHAALTSDVGLPGAVERARVRRLIALASEAAARDSKLRRLARLANRTADGIVVFTEFRDSLEAAARVLAGEHTVALLHAGLAAPERQAQLRRFLDGDARILVTTDVAGQGLNLQSRARWVVSLELPWNPTRLEQRIGRVDRIGQRRAVHATLLTGEHPEERHLRQAMRRRAAVARRALGNAVLVDVTPPSELETADALLGDRDIADPRPAASATVSIERRRTGSALARLLIRRRLHAARWKEPVAATARVQARLTSLPSIARASCHGPVLVTVTPILDAHGRELERRLVALRVPEAALRPEGTVLPDRLRIVVTRAIEARRRRLERLVRRIAEHEAGVERAIALHLQARHFEREVQPSLFSQSTARAFERAQGERRRLLEDSAARASDVAGTSTLTIGEPQPAIAFQGR